MHNGSTKKWLAFLGFVLVILLLLYYFSRQTILNQTGIQPTPTPLVTSSGNIVIYSPRPHERVSQNFQVKGKVRVFENTFSIRVKHKITGKVYLTASTQVNAQAASKFSEFVYDAHLTSDLSLKSGEELVLEVFQVSAKDGNEIDLVTIPLQFTPLLDEGK
jgi:hypothetical protein